MTLTVFDLLNQKPARKVKRDNRINEQCFKVLLKQRSDLIRGFPSGYDFKNIPDLVLKKGQVYPVKKDTYTRERMEKKQCFYNCQISLLSYPELTYVEGYALAFPGMVIHHAWLVDEQGYVIDPTWDDLPDRVYMGLPFDHDYVLDRMLELEEARSVLDDPEAKWPMLKQADLEEVLAT